MANKGVLNGLDLFSGIGGITKALEGYVRPVAYCEIDPYARGILLSRMADGSLPLAPIWDDVTTLNGHMLPSIDIIYGGFPCQDISIAGKQIGLAGKRSGLFSEIVRLAKEKNAEWLFLENVPNIRTKGLGRVLQELDCIGYDCRWGLLSASDVGANHKRERWFLLAHSRCSLWTWSLKQGTVRLEDGEQNADQHKRSSATLADTHCEGLERQWQEPCGTRTEFSDISNPSWWKFEPNVGRVAHGIPKRVDRLRALGNAVVPQQAKEAFERLMGLK